jgi:alkylation response protein AidB-like acyl-CoA dehydrogenase
MDFDLSDDHELIRRTVRDFAEGEVKPVARSSTARSASRTRS